MEERGNCDRPNVVTAKIVNTRKVHVLDFNNGASIAHNGDHLRALEKVDDGSFIKFLTPDIPKK